LEPEAFLTQLKEAGASSAEAGDYAGQFSQRHQEELDERTQIWNKEAASAAAF